ncbi:MAG: formylglycine-generating enzyme family protein [Planctomycetota bacterium]
MHVLYLFAALLCGTATGQRAAGHRSPASPWHRQEAQTGHRHVAIANPEQLDVVLHTVCRDGFGRSRPLGAGTTISLHVPPGRYALGIADAAPSVPLALPPIGELGFEAAATLQVRIEQPPAEPCTTTPPHQPGRGWRWIPAGPALCGDALGVGREDERPLRSMHSAGFWLASHETSNAEYCAFLNASVRAAGTAPAAQNWLDLGGYKCRIRWHEEQQRYQTDAPNLPVVTVSWAGAVAYCDHQTLATGAVHRLPLEREWEKAARGPGSRAYAYGDTFRLAAANQESGRLVAIGTHKANGYGLYDMTGNAFEWCLNRYLDAPAGSRDREMRMLRGGSFVLDGVFVRNAMRMRLRPSVRADDVGFRVLREPMRKNT